MALIRSGNVLTGQTLSNSTTTTTITTTAQRVASFCSGNLGHYAIGDIVRSSLLNTPATAGQLAEWNKYISQMLDPSQPGHLPATIQQTIKAVIVGCLSHGIPMSFVFNQTVQPNWGITATPLPTPLHPTSWQFTISGPFVPR
jgi:hypothetical protein